jgi:broad specificity phosphatase PhoE
MKIHFIRHGEVYNPKKVIYERLSGFPLSKRGKNMARNLVSVVAKDESLRDVKVAYVSPLLRTKQTVRPLEKYLGITAFEDDRLLESTNKFKNKKRWRLMLMVWLNPFRPITGEPYKNIAKRMREMTTDILENHKDESDIIVVSHQSPIWRLRRSFEKKKLWIPPSKRNVNLTSITTLEFDSDNNFISVSYKDTVREANL